MRPNRKLIFAMLAALSLAVGVAASPAAAVSRTQTVTPTAKAANPSIFIVGSNSDTFESMVLSQVKTNTASKQNTIAVLKMLSQTAKAGGAVNLPKSDEITQTDSTQIAATLQAVQSGITPSDYNQTYPTRGEKINSGASWEIPTTDSYVQDEVCSSSCVELDYVGCS